MNFEIMGSLSAANEKAHIFGELDANQIIKSYNSLVSKLDEAHFKVLARPDSGDPGGKFQSILNGTFRQFQQTIRVIHEEVDFCCLISFCTEDISHSKLSPVSEMEGINSVTRDQIREVKHYISSDGMVSREKRQLDGIIGVAAIGISIYSYEETMRLKSDIRSDKRELYHLKAEVRSQQLQQVENSKQIEAIRKEVDILVNFSNSAQLRLSKLLILELLGFYIRSVQRYVEGINVMLIEKKLSPTFMNAEQLKSALSKIEDRAQVYGLVPLVKNITGLISDPVSYTVNAGLIHFMIHTTLINTNLLTLYKFMPVPIPLPTGQNVIPEITKPFLAVTPTLSEHVIMSHEDIQTCKRSNNIFICHNMLTQKKLHSTCIGAIFKNLKSFILHNCRFEDIKGFKESIIQVSDTKLLVIVPPGHSISSYTSSKDFQGSDTQTLLKGNVYVEVKPGNTFSTDNYVFRSMKTYQISERILIRNISNITLDISNIEINKVKNIIPPYHHYPTTKMIDNAEDRDPYIEIGTVVIVLAFLTIGFCQILACVPRLRYHIAKFFSSLGSSLRWTRRLEPHEAVQRDLGQGEQQRDDDEQHPRQIGGEQSVATTTRAAREKSNEADRTSTCLSGTVAVESDQPAPSSSPSGGACPQFEEDRCNLSLEWHPLFHPGRTEESEKRGEKVRDDDG